MKSILEARRSAKNTDTSMSIPVTESSQRSVKPIPHPPGKPVLGNLLDFDAASPIQGVMALARQHGPIFQLELPGRELIVVSSHNLVDELSDERRFDKLVWSPLRKVRSFTGDGLFTSQTEEPSWHKAHNILLPNFSAKAMKSYMPAMVDIASQLAQKWERLNHDDEIDVPADMTRLTLDTIGLCGFNYRFNSFYREEPHPFIAAMVRALGESLEQLHRLPGQTKLMVRTRRQFEEDVTTMNTLVDTLIRERKAAGDNAAKNDLLGYMLAGADKQSGESLDDINIRYQIITFLIAGHETTSGLLSFALYFLLKHPAVLARAYEEVDRVLGTDLSATPTHAQVTKLRYITQILNESLRLWPTAPAFALYPYEPTIIGGRYAVDKQYELMVLIPMLHRDREVWGEDTEEFNPEHFSPEAERQRPANAFKPFGNGQRACIGRQFAMQEATLVLGMLLQRFELIDHTNYDLKIKETLTLKPEDFRIKVRPRTAPTVIVAPEVASESEPVPDVAFTAAVQHNTPLLVLYGSNLGTAEGIAYHIADDGKDLGFLPTVAPLDDYVGRLPQDGAVVIVSASYNGTPPDNAVQFVRWLRDETLPTDAMRGVSYAVFGCGNRDWTSTYQAVPTLIDDGLRAHGARPIYFRGEGDQRDDFDGQFRDWYGTLWPALAGALSIPLVSTEAKPKGHRYEVEMVTAQTANPYIADYNTQPFTVTATRELHRKDGSNPSPRSARHVEVTLPQGLTYTTGDHLGILPRNDDALVQRVAAHFGFTSGSTIRIRNNATSRTPLPLDQSISIEALLANYVELQDVATRAQIQTLADYTECPPEKAALLALASDGEENVAHYRENVLANHVSLIDLLEMHRSCTLPFNVYLEMLPPLRLRYYSISSSPLVDPQTASITVGVVEGPARSGRGNYAGVCSTYLADLTPGDTVMGFVRNPNTPFRLPLDPSTPLIMVSAGTGLAPFRGFLQERAMTQERGETVGPSLLFFGFRDPEQDYLYEAELSGYAARGITTIIPAISRAEGQPKRYAQQVIREHDNEVWNLLQQGASIYVCGDASRMAPEVRATFADIYQQQTGLSATEADEWLTGLTAANRYLVDIWPSS